MANELQGKLKEEFQAVWNRLPKKDREILESRIATVFEKPMTAPLAYAHKNNAGDYIVCLGSELERHPTESIHFVIAHELSHVYLEHNGPTGKPVKKMTPEERKAWRLEKLGVTPDADIKRMTEIQAFLETWISLTDESENEADMQAVSWGFAKGLFSFYGSDWLPRMNSNKSLNEMALLVASDPTYKI